MNENCKCFLTGRYLPLGTRAVDKAAVGNSYISHSAKKKLISAQASHANRMPGYPVLNKKRLHTSPAF